MAALDLQHGWTVELVPDSQANVDHCEQGGIQVLGKPEARASGIVTTKKSKQFHSAKAT